MGYLNLKNWNSNKMLFFLSLLTTLVFSSANPNSNQTNHIQRYDPAIKRTIKQISLEGTGYNLGFMHGQMLKVEIGELIEKWKNHFSKTKKETDQMIEDFFKYANFEKSIKSWTPDLYEEIKGIADGSERSFQEVMLLNLLDEFWVWLDDPANHHCSNIGVASVNGSTSYVAQNMDIDSYTDGYQTLFRVKKTSTIPEQLILSHPGLIALNGMNSSGVGMVMNTIMQLNASNKGLPVAFIVRKVLSMTNKDEIISFLTSVNHASGQSYIVGIRGEVFNYEASANKVVLHDPKNENGSVYHTNHPIVNNDVKPTQRHMVYAPELAEHQLPLLSNTYIRIEALKKRVKNKDQITDETIKEALKSKDNPFHPICRANYGRGFTFASTIMTLTGQPFLQVTAGPPDESEYISIYFKDVYE